MKKPPKLKKLPKSEMPIIQEDKNNTQPSIISYEEFKTRIKEKLGIICEDEKEKQDDNFKIETFYKYNRWYDCKNLIGMSWYTRVSEYYTPVTDLPFVNFDKILELFAPNITILCYKRIERQIIKSDSSKMAYVEESIINRKWFKLEDLYNQLVKENLLK